MVDSRVRKQDYKIGGEENDCLLLNERGWVLCPLPQNVKKKVREHKV